MTDNKYENCSYYSYLLCLAKIDGAIAFESKQKFHWINTMSLDTTAANVLSENATVEYLEILDSPDEIGHVR